MNEKKVRKVGKKKNGQRDRQTDGWMDSREDKRTEGEAYGKMDGCTDKRMYGPKDVRTNGRISRRTCFVTNNKAVYSVLYTGLAAPSISRKYNITG